MKNNFLFTSESVSEGHPDKIADQISDAILDAYIQKDKNAKVACEVLITDNAVIISGEFNSEFEVEIPVIDIAKNVITEIGYGNTEWGFDITKCKFHTFIKKQSQEINSGVELGNKKIGAGDQGMMFGYATNETPELMPLAIMLAHKLMIRHSELRKQNAVNWLGPDAKSQVTVRYIDDKPAYVETVVLSTLHKKDINSEELKKFIEKEIINNVITEELRAPKMEILINPTGAFTEGGPKTDTGLTGRKIIVDTYGGSCPHGGGAFSGKDPTKVDRSAAYMTRYIAKNIVASGLAEKTIVQIAYAIGTSKPVSLMIDLQGTGKIENNKIEKVVREIFDSTPAGIIRTLKLRRPIYKKTAVFGHFGRDLPEFTWERTDKIQELINIL